jgi:Zn2+/Cd2+-exporting ATPase
MTSSHAHDTQTQSKQTADQQHSTCSHSHGHDHAEPSANEPHKPIQAGAKLFRIATMDCSAEESEIRRVLEPLSSVRSLKFQLGARTLEIDMPDDAMPQVLEAIRSAGFNPQAIAPKPSDQSQEEHESQGWLNGITRMLLALGFACGAEILSFFAPDTQLWKLVGMAIAAIAIGLAGLDTYKKGLLALKNGKLNINALMTVAVTVAFIIGQWPEAAMVMALYAIAELIEAKAVDRARNAIQGLLALTPELAQVQQPDGNWQTLAVKTIAVDALLRIKPGERVPMDGIIVKGSSAINQASVTGESIPVEKTVGDSVLAGTINETGALEYKVTALASDSKLARIIHAVEQAQGSRAPTQRFVDRFAAIYTPAVFVVALLVAIGLPLLTAMPWLTALYKALVLLVIACPCALVISTPVTVVSGLAAAAKKGILINGGVHLENARKIKVVALDKTGTLTEGKPKLVSWRLLGSPLDGSALDEQALVNIAYSLASSSDHPVSKAISAGLLSEVKNGVALMPIDGFTALQGRGVQGSVAQQAHVLGNHRLMKERGQSSAAIVAELSKLESQGYTVTMLASDAGVLAMFAVADTVKQSSKLAVQTLQASGVRCVMLTGDNAASAQKIALEVGIEDKRSELLPEDKLLAIKNLQQLYGSIAMVGDGINDAPALAQADVGFAMGAAGTDVAMEAADVVIMNDDLNQVASTIALSRKTYAILMQNITLALGIKAVFLVLAVFGDASMWMAVFADMGASLLVIFNGWRLMKARF